MGNHADGAGGNENRADPCVQLVGGAAECGRDGRVGDRNPGDKGDRTDHREGMASAVGQPQAEAGGGEAGREKGEFAGHGDSIFRHKACDDCIAYSCGVIGYLTTLFKEHIRADVRPVGPDDGAHIRVYAYLSEIGVVL